MFKLNIFYFYERCDNMKKTLTLLLAAFMTLGFTACDSANSSDEENTTTTTTTTVIQTSDITETEKQTTTTTETTTTKEQTTTTKETTPTVQESYEHNSNYDIVETATYKDSVDYTHIIHKVKAKKDTSISATLLAYDSNNNVIGKSDNKIVLTAGEFNYFEYIFDKDISNAKITAQFSTDDDSFMEGPRHSVQMVTSNKVDDNLYITFKQLTDKLGSLAKFKILYYKNGKIVDSENNGYFNIYAKNMNGKDQTDVATVWVYEIDYDKFECYFEP